MEYETNLTVTSPAFESGGTIPIKYTGYGKDISPELHFSQLDGNAKSVAIIMDDVDHPIRPNFNHWVVWNIPAVATIPENIPRGKIVVELDGAVQGRAYGKHRYRGPKPPFGWSHRYRYHVYVLDSMLDLDASAKKADLLEAMGGHVLQYGLLEGKYR